MGGCAHEVGWHHEIWSEPTLKTEAQRHWDEFAGLEESGLQVREANQSRGVVRMKVTACYRVNREGAWLSRKSQ